MWPSSKLQLSILGLILTSNLVACSLGKPQERSDTPQDTASFYIEKAEAPTVTNVKFHPNISLPVAKEFSFKVCLKESQYMKPILNHNFEISGGEKTVSVNSDSSGCVIWSESIAYNHLAQAQRIRITRSILAKGIQKGQRQIDFALNPWEDQGEALLNKNIPDLKNAEFLMAANAETSRGLWIDDIRLTIDEKKVASDGLHLKVEVRAQPSLPVIKAAGQRVLEPLTKGKFNAEIYLLNVLTENQKEVRRPLTAKVQTSGRIANNALLMEAEVVLPETSRSGQVQLALKVSPVDAPENIGPFEGVFNIGDFDKIKGNFMSRLKNNFQDAQGKLKIEQYLTESQIPGLGKASNEADIAKDDQHSGYQKSQVQIDPLVFNIIGFKNTNSNTREKVFTVTACMATPIDSNPLKAQVFQVKKVNGGTENLRSNEKGCITWEDSVTFQYLESECWMARQVQIANSNYSMNQTLSLQINPWADSTSSVRDARQYGKQELLCARGKSKIVLFRYDFDKKTVRYPIDSYLNIKVQKEGILKLQARLKRPSLVDPSGFEDSALPPGKYLLRWAVVDHAVEDFTQAANSIYQVQEKTVQIDAAGTIAEPLTLESSNLRALGNTNYILFELRPEADSANLNTTTFRGPLVLSNTTEGGNLESLREGNDSLILKLRDQFAKDLEAQKNLQLKLSKKETFSNMENLGLVNLNQETQTLPLRKALASPMAWQSNVPAQLKNIAPVSTQELSDWLQSGKLSQALARKFCSFWFFDQMRRPLASRKGQPLLPLDVSAAGKMTDLCYREVAQNPKSFFELQYRYFLKDASKTKDLTSEVKDLAFNQTFTLSQSHDISTTKTLSADINAGFSTSKWMSPMSIGGGFRYQIAHAEGDRTSSANSSVVQSGESLLLEKMNFQIQAKGYEKCAVIRLNPEILDPSRTPLMKYVNRQLKPDSLSRELGYGVMVCEGTVQSRNVNFTESYFVINQKNNYTQAIDSNSDFGRPLFMAVRGLSDFRRLLQLLSGQMKAPGSALSQIQQQHTLQPTLAPALAHGIATYPGQYVADE